MDDLFTFGHILIWSLLWIAGWLCIGNGVREFRAGGQKGMHVTTGQRDYAEPAAGATPDPAP